VVRSLPNAIVQPHSGGYAGRRILLEVCSGGGERDRFLDGLPRNLASEKEIQRQFSRQATYLI
jgi:hypothetical protein